MTSFARFAGPALALASLIAVPLTLACSPELPAFRGTTRSVLLRPGESVHFTLIATRAAIDQAQNGMTFRANVTPYRADVPATVVPDDASLDELFDANYGNVSAAELARICPGTGECTVGVTLTLDETAEVTELSVRFGVESYGGFTDQAIVGTEID